MKSTVESAPWERQPKETAKAFEAFRFYRDTPAKDRSLRSCVRNYYRLDPESDAAAYATRVRQWATWSGQHAWVDRVAAWTSELDRAARAEAIEAAKEMRRRHVAEAQAIQSKAIKRLQQMDTSKLSPADVLRYFVEGARLERLAMGEPDQIVEQRTNKRAEELSDDELASIATGGG